MLQRLSIRNYALIASIDWDCDRGWTVLTGETGSGKSILLGALGLILGDRAEGAALLNGDKCIVEAEFTPGEAARTLLADLNEGNTCTIRRSIAPGGRSRAYVNDEPVKLHFLKALAPLLVDLHGQQDGQRLHASEGLLHAIDRFSEEAGTLAAEWRQRYAAWERARSEWSALSQLEGLPEADSDYLRFQLEELEGIDCHDPELRGLDQRLESLEHAQEIRGALESVEAALNADGPAIISRLRQVEQLLDRVAGVHPPTAALVERLRSCRIELDDIAREAQSTAEDVDLDPSALARAEAQRDKINRLFDKHRVTHLDDLADKQQAMVTQLAQAESRAQRLNSLSAELQTLKAALDMTGQALDAARQRSASALAGAIEGHLGHLKLAAAKVGFQWTPAPAPEVAGPARVSMSFSANPGQPMQPLTRVASGGERSRVMLALKAVLTEHLEVPTLILDEIDAGVSGDVAARMADLITTIARRTQVITISHLPQVAGKANHHFKVFKEDRGDEAHTGMSRLDEAGRVEELATMLSGSEVADTARAQARALLDLGA